MQRVQPGEKISAEKINEIISAVDTRSQTSRQRWAGKLKIYAPGAMLNSGGAICCWLRRSAAIDLPRRVSHPYFYAKTWPSLMDRLHYNLVTITETARRNSTYGSTCDVDISQIRLAKIHSPSGASGDLVCHPPHYTDTPPSMLCRTTFVRPCIGQLLHLFEGVYYTDSQPWRWGLVRFFGGARLRGVASAQINQENKTLQCLLTLDNEQLGGVNITLTVTDEAEKYYIPSFTYNPPQTSKIYPVLSADGKFCFFSTRDLCVEPMNQWWWYVYVNDNISVFRGSYWRVMMPNEGENATPAVTADGKIVLIRPAYQWRRVYAIYTWQYNEWSCIEVTDPTKHITYTMDEERFSQKFPYYYSERDWTVANSSGRPASVTDECLRALRESLFPITVYRRWYNSRAGEWPPNPYDGGMPPYTDFYAWLRVTVELYWYAGWGYYAYPTWCSIQCLGAPETSSEYVFGGCYVWEGQLIYAWWYASVDTRLITWEEYQQVLQTGCLSVAMGMISLPPYPPLPPIEWCQEWW